MHHRTHWTPEKINQRLDLIFRLVYMKQKALSSFCYRELERPLTLTPLARMRMILAGRKSLRMKIVDDMSDDLKKFIEQEDITLIGYRQIRNAMRNG